MRHADARTLGIGVKVLGLRFLSIKAAAKHFNTTTYKIKFLVEHKFGRAQSEWLIKPSTRKPHVPKAPFPIRHKGWVYTTLGELRVSVGGRKFSAADLSAKLASGKSLAYCLAELSKPKEIYKSDHTSVTVTVDGREFPSMKAAAASLSVSVASIRWSLREGTTSAKEITRRDRLKYLAASSPGSVYCIRNKLSGRRYIGITIKSVETRVNSHLVAARTGAPGPLYADIRKYGLENFSVKTLLVQPAQQLGESEKAYIKKFRTQDAAYGYNVHPGGCIGGLTSSKGTITYKGTEYKSFSVWCERHGISVYRSKGFLYSGKKLSWILKEGLRWKSLTLAQQKSEANGYKITYKGKQTSLRALVEKFNLVPYNASKLLVKNPYCTGEFIVLNAKRMPQELRNVVSA